MPKGNKIYSDNYYFFQCVPCDISKNFNTDKECDRYNKFHTRNCKYVKMYGGEQDLMVADVSVTMHGKKTITAMKGERAEECHRALTKTSTH